MKKDSGKSILEYLRSGAVGDLFVSLNFTCSLAVTTISFCEPAVQRSGRIILQLLEDSVDHLTLNMCTVSNIYANHPKN